jgi:hypothetical protein
MSCLRYRGTTKMLAGYFDNKIEAGHICLIDSESMHNPPYMGKQR